MKEFASFLGSDPLGSVPSMIESATERDLWGLSGCWVLVPAFVIY